MYHGILPSMELHPAYTEKLTHVLSLGTMTGITVLVILILYIGLTLYHKKSTLVTEMLSRYVLEIGFFASLFGMVMSLFYSQILHFAPCDLCWFQRVFLYPLIFIFGLAWWRKERNVLPYTLLLSVVGLAIALYHHMLQIGFDLMKPCSSAPFAVDCAKPDFMEFGFVTFPLMSAVLFAFLALSIITALYFSKRK